MDILLALAVFTAAMLGCIVLDCSMIPGLLVGYLCFLAVGLYRKNKLQDLLRMSLDGMKDVLPVIRILLIIGVLTATWRMSGTILYFVYYGVRMITPRLFILAAFLLTCIISYALGTSFGVSATVGVILMAIARSGGVPAALAAGAIFSGVYYGDRGSPVSSAAAVVAALTGTDGYENVGRMHKTALLPLMLSVAIYGVLSWLNPIQTIDPAMLEAIEQTVSLSHLLIVPVLCMLILPLCKLPIWATCLCSITAAGALSVGLQGIGLFEFLKACVFGYEPTAGLLGDMLKGGGAWSMMEVNVILLISCTYSKLFEGTGMMEDIAGLFHKSIGRVGPFLTSLWLSVATVCIFCNQTIASIICITLLKEPYKKADLPDEALAIDMENSVILIGGLVPWSIASSVPLGFMGADASALPYSLYLWLVPLCYIFTRKKFRFNHK